MTENEDAWKKLCVTPGEIIEQEIEGYAFKMRVMGWLEIEKARSDCMNIDKSSGNIDFDQATFNEKVLTGTLVSGPFDPDNKHRFVLALKNKVKEQIVSFVIGLHGMSTEETKNSKGHSEDSKLNQPPQSPTS